MEASLKNHPTLLPEAARSFRSAKANPEEEEKKEEPDRGALLPLLLPLPVVVVMVVELGLAARVWRVVALKSRAKAAETPAGGAQLLLLLLSGLLPSGTVRASARIETIASRFWRGKRICCSGVGGGGGGLVWKRKKVVCRFFVVHPPDLPFTKCLLL